MSRFGKSVFTQFLRPEQRTNFVFEKGYFGVYNSEKKKIKVNLPSFTRGGHDNDGKRQNKYHASINEIINHICYTINHEDIHEVQDNLEKVSDHVIKEKIVYNMIGNGQNGFFNLYYDIPCNTEWIKTLDPEYGHSEVRK